MNQIGYSYRFEDYGARENERPRGSYDVELVEFGTQLTLHVTFRPQAGGPRSEWVFPLGRPKEISIESYGVSTGAGDLKQLQEQVADLASKLVDFKKSESGLFIPKLKGDESFIIDSPGSETARVFSPDEGAYEKIPKAELERKGDKCRCSMIDLLTRGCKGQCRGVGSV